MATTKNSKTTRPGSQDPQKRREQLEGNEEQKNFPKAEQKKFAQKSGLPYKEEDQKKSKKKKL
jgi:hypothetical protein